MPSPSDSKLPSYTFKAHGFDFCVCLFDYDPINWPDIVYPVLLKKNGTNWDKIDERQPIWKDQKDEIPVATMLSHIVKDFNLTINQLGNVVEPTYNQKLATLISTKLSVVNNQLVILS